MEHEALERLADELVDPLLVLGGAERRHDETLRFASREESAPVRARENADLARDRTHVREGAPVRAALLPDDDAPDDLALELLEDVLEMLLTVGMLGPVLFDGRLVYIRQGALPGELAVDPVAARDVGEVIGAELRLERLVDLEGLEGALRLQLALREELALEGVDLLDVLVAELERLDEGRLAHFLRAALDHADRVVGAGDRNVHEPLFELAEERVHDEFVVLEPDADTAQNRAERYVGEGQRERGARDAEHVGGLALVAREHAARDLDLEAERVGEERPYRPVDEAGAEGFLLAGPSLASEEAAGDLAGRVEFLAVLDGEREEILNAFPVLRGDRRHENDRRVDADEHGTVRLSRDPARLEKDIFAAERPTLSDHPNVSLHSNGEYGTAPPGSVRSSRRRTRAPELLPEVELLDDCAVLVDPVVPEVVEKLAPLAHELQ